MAKDCMGGIRDPDWLDLPPVSSLGMGVHSLTNLPANSTIKKKAAIIIMAVEVILVFSNKQLPRGTILPLLITCLLKLFYHFTNLLK